MYEICFRPYFKYVLHVFKVAFKSFLVKFAICI